MTNSNTVSNANTMTNSNTVSNANTMTKSNSMSNANSMCNNSRMSNSMGNWVSNNSRVSNSMGNRMSNSISICCNTIISDISNITIIIIDMLDTAIRKVDRVGTFYNTSTIIGLSLVEGSTRVVISNSIGVRVGRGLSKVRLGISSNSMFDD